MTPQKGTPTVDGEYVAYIDGSDGQCDRKLLWWHDGAWWFHLNTARYTPRVCGWVGPLQDVALWELVEPKKPQVELDL